MPCFPRLSFDYLAGSASNLCEGIKLKGEIKWIPLACTHRHKSAPVDGYSAGAIFFYPIATARRNRNRLNPLQTTSIVNAGNYQGSHFPFEDKSPAG